MTDIFVIKVINHKFLKVVVSTLLFKFENCKINFMFFKLAFMLFTKAVFILSKIQNKNPVKL